MNQTPTQRSQSEMCRGMSAHLARETKNARRNDAIAQRYNLPSSLTGVQVLALSMGAFANHSFTLAATGEHISAISESMVQVISANGYTPRTFLRSEDQTGYEGVMASVFCVAPEFDPTW